jgi:hypothetical protein
MLHGELQPKLRQPCAERVVEKVAGLSGQVELSRIITHDADEPKAGIDT